LRDNTLYRIWGHAHSMVRQGNGHYLFYGSFNEPVEGETHAYGDINCTVWKHGKDLFYVGRKVGGFIPASAYKG